jgi:hypothetical protein
MSILKVEPSAINTDASFVFGDIATTGNITVGDAIIQSTAGGDIEFVTTTGSVTLDANTVSFLSNVSTQGAAGSNGYVGSQGVPGFTGSSGTNGFTGSAGTNGFTGSAGTAGTNGFTGSIGYTGSTSEATSVTVSPAFKGALLSLSASESVSSTASVINNFTVVEYDTTGGLLTAAASRFTIPAGVTKVKCAAAIADVTSVTDQLALTIRINGSITYSTSTDIDSGGGDHTPGFTPVLSVVEGDYLEVWAAAPTTRTVDTSFYTWFSIEVVEGSILDTTSVIRTTGFTGSAGTTGFTGSGGTGFTGSTGTGFTGSAGTVGFTGSGGTGFTGSAGQVQYQPGTAVPYILVKTNGSQQSVGSGSEVLINLNTVSSGNVELSNGSDGFSIPRTGLYNIDVNYITNNSTHVDITEIHARIYVNGTYRYSIFESSPAFGFNKSLSGSTNLYLNQGDIVKIYFWAFNDTLIVGVSGCSTRISELLPPSAGFVGSSGIAGFTGSAGTNGFTGSVGSGFTGSAGSNGFTGSAGTAGSAGFTGSIGFTGSAAPLNLPVVNRSSAYTLTAADVGDYVNITTGGVTVPSGVFVSGDVVSIYNNSASSQTITTTAVTCYLVGTATTGNRTLAQRGLATLLCVGTNEFVISGGGLT